MKIRSYPYRLRRVDLDYEFDSIGPRGVIRKIVNYEDAIVEGTEVVSLALGDWNEQRRKWDGDVVSDNKDTNIILATIALTCVKVMSLHPTVRIYAKGSTPARNRLYRIGISKNWKEIDAIMDIEGKRLGKWESFKPDVNYDAFRAKLKSNE